MSAQFHWDPETYLEMMRAEVPRFDELQSAAVAAIPAPPARVLDLGIGTGETSRRLLETFPDAEITGLDESPEMVFRARDLGIEVRLARMEDPLPDGPWDLVIAVLSVHHLELGGKARPAAAGPRAGASHWCSATSSASSLRSPRSTPSVTSRNRSSRCSNGAVARSRGARETSP